MKLDELVIGGEISPGVGKEKTSKRRLRIRREKAKAKAKERKFHISFILGLPFYCIQLEMAKDGSFEKALS